MFGRGRFNQLLSKENIYLFDVFLVNHISHYLGKANIGLSYFLPGFNNGDIKSIMEGIIGSYGNPCGKAFARKWNLYHGVDQTKTIRTTLGTINYLNKMKKKMRLKEEQE